MEQKMLKQELARGELRKFYVLFGEEQFLVNHYASEIEKACGTSVEKTIFDGTTTSVSSIIMAAESMPLLGFESETGEGANMLNTADALSNATNSSTAKRLLLIKDSKLFASGRKEESEQMADYLATAHSQRSPAHSSPDTIIIFCESETDKRTRIFKKAAELGNTLECTPLSPQDLAKWVILLAKEKGKALKHPLTFAPDAANFMVRYCGTNMANLANEAEKLFHYCADIGTAAHAPSLGGEVTTRDITEICTPTLESRIFDLTKAVSAGRITDALKNYHDMLALKESPIMILTMVIRQLRIMLLCKCRAEENATPYEIARELGLRDFMVNEALSHGRRFTPAQLVAALENCQDTDIRIKTGLATQEMGVEMLIVSLC